MAKQAEFYSKTHAKEIAMNTLDKLHELDQQRELIIAELENAKENVVKFDQPEAKAEELSELAKGFFDFTKFILKKDFLILISRIFFVLQFQTLQKRNWILW